MKRLRSPSFGPHSADIDRPMFVMPDAGASLSPPAGMDRAGGPARSYRPLYPPAPYQHYLQPAPHPVLPLSAMPPQQQQQQQQQFQIQHVQHVQHQHHVSPAFPQQPHHHHFQPFLTPQQQQQPPSSYYAVPQPIHPQTHYALPIGPPQPSQQHHQQLLPPKQPHQELQREETHQQQQQQQPPQTGLVLPPIRSSFSSASPSPIIDPATKITPIESKYDSPAFTYLDQPRPVTQDKEQNSISQIPQRKQQARPASAPDDAAPVPTRTAVKKKMHFKSRNGCVVCKKRKIKCDEQRPKCRNCGKHGVMCEYARDISAYSIDKDVNAINPVATTVTAAMAPITTTSSSNDTRIAYPAPAPTPTPPPAPVPVPLPVDRAPGSPRTDMISADLNFKHLNLLVHFVQSTSQSMATWDGKVKLWTETVPRLACRVPCLMYAVFALTATHLAHIHRTSSNETDAAVTVKEYEIVSQYYRDLALDTFKAVTKKKASQLERTEDDVLAAMVVPVLLSIEGFAFKHSPNCLYWRSDVSMIVSIDRWLPLRKAITNVQAHWQTHALTSPSSSAVIDEWELNWPALPPINGPHRLQYLIKLIKDADESRLIKDNGKLERAINLLDQLVEFHHAAAAAAVITGINKNVVRYVLDWPLQCSTSFLTRLSERDGISLVVYVHFLTTLNLAAGSDTWWPMQTIEHDVRLICNILGPRWEYWLAWPRQQLPFALFA
ncbi:hypothetical protein V1514DRAFT_155423 [Lipomyces japonicus]|uniref:uncharacterized protein n=1 Tax=Lipomyces japonicus TaxID=56871 RepID=UPI0034CF15E4